LFSVSLYLVGWQYDLSLERSEVLSTPKEWDLDMSSISVGKPRPLTEYFAKLQDSRIQLKCEHNFMDIILIVICGTIAGADDFVAARQFARAKETWLRERLGLKLLNGIP
jgi:hypothetical protein